MPHNEPVTIETLDPRLIVVGRDPVNCETPLSEQLGVITPTELYYLRDHFKIPSISTKEWRLRIHGKVARPIELTYDQLRALPSRTILVTMECAGNGRSTLEPKADGEPWQFGAVATAEWTGVSLGTVLAAAGLAADVAEIVTEGADSGLVPAAGGTLSFIRSLPLAKALDPDTLLAYAMNGEPLPAEHGFPCRLVASGWYGMPSVKWINRIEAVSEPYVGFYQTDRYIMAHPELGETETTPLRDIRVRSLIVEPSAGATVSLGEHRLRGLAWSGAAPIARVEVSVDGGASWDAAELVSPPQRYAWRRWEYAWRTASAGSATLRSRAVDEAGNTQPSEPEWNKLGYANNAVQLVKVTIA